uniref:FTH domain-containing protein n=1 Tax=Caenorhabditis tropicalis TaxID=1561998 RepID=A0A1I7T934_9PELO
MRLLPSYIDELSLTNEGNSTGITIKNSDGCTLYKSRFYDNSKHLLIQIIVDPETSVNKFMIHGTGRDAQLKDIVESVLRLKLKVENVYWYLPHFTPDDFRTLSTLFDMDYLKTIRFKMVDSEAFISVLNEDNVSPD